MSETGGAVTERHGEASEQSGADDDAAVRAAGAA